MTNPPTEMYQPVEAEVPARKRRSAPRWLLGALAVLLAMAAGGLQIAGIVQASNLNWERGTLLAGLAIGVSVVAFVVGLVAVTTNRGRRLGIAAMIAAVVANPFVLAQLLGALG
ncbi:hypothetical protein ACX3O0_13625 [Homoserinimonas sp. A447]